MKACFKCGVTKPITEFYRHPQMGDGHLGKCKDCNRRDTELRRVRLVATDPEWAQREIMRMRAKARRTDPVKVGAQRAVKKAISSGDIRKEPCHICGNPNAQAHHDDYSEPLNVRWLCVRHHNEFHNEMRRLATINEMNTQPAKSNRYKKRKQPASNNH